MTKEQVLKQYFGYTHFRKGQQALMERILQGADVLGIMPTGAGKSLCFQVPALLLPGLTLVISPLISLMRDQVLALLASGIPAAYINSALSAGQISRAIENAREGQYKILYVAPERLATPEFLDFARDTEISMVTVDEAHCVSQWGQDFRPSYLKIGEFIRLLPCRPIVSAFTATATGEVKEDILRLLELQEPYIEATGFDRENLYFEVQKPGDKYRALLSYLEGNPGGSGIVYCATRKTVEKVCERLQEDGYLSTRYHAGLSERERTENQDDFLYDRKTVMVATNAFGMGIDKSNVGFVVHYNMPKNIESYYQEAGRAGRDGTPADCILLYGGQDVVTNQFLIERSSTQNDLEPQILAQVKEKDRENLKQMTYYCHTTDCLRAYLLHYFGDHAQSRCENCGNCKAEFELVDILEDSKKILSCIHRMRERYGVQVLIGTLRGSRSRKIHDFGLDALPTYGIMKGVSAEYIRAVINHLVLSGHIVLTNSEFPIVTLGAGCKALLHSDEPLWMKAPPASRRRGRRADAARQKLRQPGGELDPLLLAKLKELRLEMAAQSGVPAFVVFPDATLIDMCRKRPASKEEMLEVSGVGAVKFGRYGEAFLKAIAQHAAPPTASPPAQGTEWTTQELCDYLRSSFEPTAEPIPVSMLADRLNALLLQKCSLKVGPVKLARFFEEKGLLQTESTDGKNARVASAQGLALGIQIVNRTKADGSAYRQNLYGLPAQEWLMAHLDELLSLIA